MLDLYSDMLQVILETIYMNSFWHRVSLWFAWKFRNPDDVAQVWVCHHTQTWNSFSQRTKVLNNTIQFRHKITNKLYNF